MNDDWSFEKHVADIESAEALARAEVAEAEVKRLRDANTRLAVRIHAAESRANATEAELERLRGECEARENVQARLIQERDKAEADVARLRAQVEALEHATCSCCDRSVNRKIDACVCDYCYEDKLQ